MKNFILSFFLIGSFTIIASPVRAIENISTRDNYIAGGIVGTVLGLGVGHGIQGRYFDKGLLFTITESASIVLIIIGAAVPMPKGVSIPMVIVGALGLAGFKIWEIIDVWTGPAYAHTTLLPDVMHQNGYALQMARNTSGMSTSMLQGGLTFHF